nr:MAG TPA: hypothetical protein [Caudoviricetes sp.]
MHKPRKRLFLSPPSRNQTKKTLTNIEIKINTSD